MFYGRDDEINKINKLIDSNKFESIVISGRRRIGKTFLLNKIVNDYNGSKIFHIVTDNDVNFCIKKLWESICMGLKFDFELSDIDSILKFVFDLSVREKILFVIDEYPYLRNNIKYLDSLLQVYIDTYKEKSKMKLIICGSYVKVMHEIVSHGNPLFRRFTEEITLTDLNYLDSSSFYSNYTLEDKVRTYAIFGGNPFYNTYVNNSLTFEENILNVLNSRFLLDTPIKIYEDEISNIGGANHIFSQISDGKCKYSDLASSKIIDSNLPHLLKPLINMGLIRKEVPINDVNSKKKTFYYINDNFLDFYYRYIHPNQSVFLTMNKQKFYELYIKEDLETYYIPKKFELLCREAIIYMNINLLNNIDFKGIGKYWFDDSKNKINVEFDITCTNLDDTYTFFECKFSKNPIDDSIVNKKIFQIDNLGIENYKLGFVSKSGYELTDKKDYILFDLKNIYLEK